MFAVNFVAAFFFFFRTVSVVFVFFLFGDEVGYVENIVA